MTSQALEAKKKKTGAAIWLPGSGNAKTGLLAPDQAVSQT
jgi:hypothetical protein